jgi:hypothetical protein
MTVRVRPDGDGGEVPTHPARRGAEVPGDTGAPDLVAPTGEEMPVASHDQVGDGPPRGPESAPSRGTPLPTKSSRVPR